MTIETDTPVSLVPEDHLLSMLPPFWKQRFERALTFLMDTLERTPPPSWHEVAKHCAVSPYHFHRMFRIVFGETPAQYCRRIRLRLAVTLLFNEPDLSITDIAHACGFSASQALAKALRRQLGLSAKAIRAMRSSGDTSDIEELLLRLGHPAPHRKGSVERDLADKLSFHVQGFPQRELQVTSVSPPSDGNIIAATRGKAGGRSQDLVLVMALEDYDKPFAQQTVRAGYYAPDAAGANYRLPAGPYLCCRVALSSESGYIAAWDALYAHMIKHDLEPDDDGHTLEIVHNPASLSVESDEMAEMSLSVRLKPQPANCKLDPTIKSGGQ
ncbi:helix-turn-helix transcriptional regulator [Exilibacterium tricleocarpae]|uniref:Helix-turn-helix transcriptional regulator n=1 Tax=Exilibacterium tricleocarpae TaxID=2591008 RepID=A0A545TBA2_9GAMM|nr:helix-turn-helix transcriptional regulator [Exilibacterium tricleocarpae]TQV74495.1 helix-turn-helix transcriptional regulator [Exilibacterium tricleocarpae]